MAEIHEWQLDAVDAVMRRCDALSDFSSDQFMETLEKLGFTIVRREPLTDRDRAKQNRAKRGERYCGSPEVHTPHLWDAYRTRCPGKSTKQKRGPDNVNLIMDEVQIGDSKSEPAWQSSSAYDRGLSLGEAMEEAEEPQGQNCTLITAHDPHGSCLGIRYPTNHVKAEYRGKFPSETQFEIPRIETAEIAAHVRISNMKETIPAVGSIWVHKHDKGESARVKEFSPVSSRVVFETDGDQANTNDWTKGTFLKHYEIADVRPCAKLSLHGFHSWPISGMGGDEPEWYACSGEGSAHRDFVRLFGVQCDDNATHMPHGICPGRESTEERDTESVEIKVGEVWVVNEERLHNIRRLEYLCEKYEHGVTVVQVDDDNVYTGRMVKFRDHQGEIRTRTVSLFTKLFKKEES